MWNCNHIECVYPFTVAVNSIFAIYDLSGFVIQGMQSTRRDATHCNGKATRNIVYAPLKYDQNAIKSESPYLEPSLTLDRSVFVCVCVIAISYVYWWHMIYCHLLFNFRDRPFMLPYFDLFYKFTWKWTHKSQLNIFGIENHIWFKWKQYFTWKSHYPLIHIGLYICFSCAVGRFGLALIHLIIIGFIYTVICNNGELRRSNFCRAELHTARHGALA